VLRQHLIDGDAEADVLGLGLLGHHAAQPAGGAHRVIRRVLATGAREVADHRHVVAVLGQRREDRRDLELASSLRHPARGRRVANRRTIRHVDAAKAERRDGPLLPARERRRHRVEKRQRERGAESLQHGSPRQ
jgi:hypothetical protein